MSQGRLRRNGSPIRPPMPPVEPNLRFQNSGKGRAFQPAWSGVVYFFCSFSFLLSLAMLYYPPGRACSNFEPLDPFDCKEVAASLTFANVEGYADHVSRNRQTEFLGAGPKHFEMASVRN